MIATAERTEIRALTIKELPLCLEGGRAFYEEMHVPGQFIDDIFLATWQRLYENGTGIIFVAFEQETPTGGIGIVLYPDPQDAQLVAQEMFWFVLPSARAGMTAYRLLKTFKRYADEHGAVRRVVAHYLGPRMEKLSRLYQKIGYRPLEVFYIEDVSCRPE